MGVFAMGQRGEVVDGPLGARGELTRPGKG